MKKINKIFIILTPYHKRVLNTFFKKEYNRSDKLTLLYDRDIKPIFSKSKFFKKPIRSICEYRNEINKIKFNLANLIANNNFNEDLDIFIFSDRDIYTQIFLNVFYSEFNIKLIAIDEGTAYYAKNKFKDKIINIIYYLFTKILFGYRLRNTIQMGLDSRIDEIYVRSLKDIKVKNINAKYFELPNYNNQSNKTITNGKVLIYSFSNQYLNISDSSKNILIKELVDIFVNKIIYLKPHPSENIYSLKKNISSDVIFLDKDEVGENINYYDYEYIINFNSSIVIDIIFNKYPLENVITIDLPNYKLDMSFFDRTKRIESKELKEIILEKLWN